DLGPSGGAAGADPQEERQVLGPSGGAAGAGPPGGATGLGPSGGAAVRAGPPGGATGLGPSGGAAGATPQMERQVSGPQAECGGRRTPRWSDRRGGGRRDPQAEATGLGPPGGSGGHRETPGTTVGSESTGMTAGTGSDIGWSGWTAGIASGHQASGHLAR
ncbi:unnamed protein product, partial [Staurois parvus]